MALKLTQRPPTSVECIEKEGVSSFMYPKRSVIRFDFPAYGNHAAGEALLARWHERERQRSLACPMANGWAICRVCAARNRRRSRGRCGAARPPAAGTDHRRRLQLRGLLWRARQTANRASTQQPNGSVFIGDKGIITTGTYGENTRLIPVEKMKDYKFPPELLTRSPGHYRDWIRACKGGDPSCSNFSISGPMTEWILLGVIALRVEGKIEWDAAKMRITNNAEANKYIKPFVKKGWQMTYEGLRPVATRLLSPRIARKSIPSAWHFL